MTFLSTKTQQHLVLPNGIPKKTEIELNTIASLNPYYIYRQ